MLTGKRVLVTGGTGSLGAGARSAGCSTGELGQPARITVFSRDEAKQHDMRLAYQHRRVATDEVIYHNFDRSCCSSGSATCATTTASQAALRGHRRRLQRRGDEAGADVRVLPLRGRADQHRRRREPRPTRSASARPPVETVVGHLDRQGVQAGQRDGDDEGAPGADARPRPTSTAPTRASCCVRYGNVLASRGSVIPLFLDQIRHGGPVTITTPEMTRFLLSLDQAVDIVFAALRSARPGETYVPRVPVGAHRRRRRGADRRPRRSTMVFTGIRPGEKVHEILVSEEECHRTSRAAATTSIAPILPELRDGPVQPALDRRVSSATDVRSPRTASPTLLARHGLDAETESPSTSVLERGEGHDRARDPARDHPPARA